MRDYQMFTDVGNEAIDDLVREAHMLKLSWPHVLVRLAELSSNPGFGEATDTEVRESVFCALGFDDKAVRFYS